MSAALVRVRSAGSFLPVLLPFLLLAFSLAGCRAPGGAPYASRATRAASAISASSPASALPRPDPSYIAWLERQSMLARAPELAAEVSGTGRAFASPGDGQRAQILLRAAPSWLWLSPEHAGSASPLARKIISGDLLARMRGLGLGGLFLAPLAENAAAWSGESAAGGWDAVSFDFSAAAGAEEEVSDIYERAEESGVQTGGELPPAATGIGPDFMLQARNALRHAGLYAMIAVPRKDWSLLPAPRGEWEGAPLSAQEAAALVEAGVSPPPFARDKAGAGGGWASSGEITGVDGAPRRWLYRFARNPGRPVLLWQDPSGAAKRLLSAAIIRQTGLLGQTLTGMRIEALMGLEEGDAPDLEPGLEAAATLAREIRRYGGWSMLCDALPPETIARVLEGPTDFCAEAESGEAAEKALASGDASSLLAVLRKLKNLPLQRTARGVIQEESRPFSPEKIFAELAKNSAAPQEDDFANACMLALAFRVGLPGLAMFAPQELGLEYFGSSPAVPLAHYEKLRKAASRLLLARAESGLAQGSLLDAQGGEGGWAAALSSLPDGGIWLCAANYGAREKRVKIKLPFTPGAARDALSGAEIECLEGAAARLTLDGHAVRHVIFQNRKRG